LASGHLELRLPGAFVERAVLPLVLDPLFGVPFVVGSNGQGYVGAMDAAYDATNDVFLIAWSQGTEVLGRLVRPDGALVGPMLCLICAASRLRAIDSLCNVRARSTLGERSKAASWEHLKSGQS
jgi:hypothetical protein